MKPNTSDNDDTKNMILRAYPDYPDLSYAELWELMDKCLKQGYAKALDLIKALEKEGSRCIEKHIMFHISNWNKLIAKLKEKS